MGSTELLYFGTSLNLSERTSFYLQGHSRHREVVGSNELQHVHHTILGWTIVHSIQPWLVDSVQYKLSLCTSVSYCILISGGLSSVSRWISYGLNFILSFVNYVPVLFSYS